MKNFFYAASIFLLFTVGLFAQDGTLETTFGNNGVTITDIDGEEDFAKLIGFCNFK